MEPSCMYSEVQYAFLRINWFFICIHNPPPPRFTKHRILWKVNCLEYSNWKLLDETLGGSEQLLPPVRYHIFRLTLDWTQWTNCLKNRDTGSPSKALLVIVWACMRDGSCDWYHYNWRHLHLIGEKTNSYVKSFSFYHSVSVVDSESASFNYCLYLVLELLSHSNKKMAPSFSLFAKTLKNILFDLVLSATDSGTDIAAAYKFFE